MCPHESADDLWFRVVIFDSSQTQYCPLPFFDSTLKVASTYHWTPKGGASPSTCGGSNDACKGHIGVYPSPGSQPIDFSADFHVWELNWTPTELSFTVDGVSDGDATEMTCIFGEVISKTYMSRNEKQRTCVKFVKITLPI